MDISRRLPHRPGMNLRVDECVEWYGNWPGGGGEDCSTSVKRSEYWPTLTSVGMVRRPGNGNRGILSNRVRWKIRPATLRFFTGKTQLVKPHLVSISFMFDCLN